MTRIIIQHEPDISDINAMHHVMRVIAYGLETPHIAIDNIEVIRRRTRPDVAAASFVVRRVPPVTT